MLINSTAKSLFFSLISSKKFQVKTSAKLVLHHNNPTNKTNIAFFMSLNPTIIFVETLQVFR